MKPPSSRRTTIHDKAVVSASASLQPPKIVPDFLKFNCPKCGNPTAFQGAMAGKLAACPACAVKIIIPSFSGDICYLAGDSITVSKKPTVKGSGVARPPSRIVQRVETPIDKPLPAPGGPAPKITKNAPLMVAVSVGATFLLLIAMYVVLRGKHNPPEAAVASAAMTPAPISPAPSAPVAKAPEPSVPIAAAPAATSAPALEKPAPVSHEPSKTEELASKPVSATQLAAPVAQDAGQATELGKNAKTSEYDSRPEPDDGALKIASAPEAPAQPADVSKLLALQDRKQTKEEDVDDSHSESKKIKEAPKNVVDFGSDKANTSPVAKKPEVQAKAAIAPAVKPVEPPICPVCLGRGLVPNQPLRAYVHMEGEAAPNPALAVPWRFCPKCQAAKDPKLLLDDEAQRLAAGGNSNKWKQQANLPLVFSETHHVSFYGPNPQITKKIATMLEDLTIHLEKVTNVTLLTQARPDTHEILMVNDAVGYNAIIDALQKMSPNQDFSLARKVSCISDATHAFYKSSGLNAENMAIFVFSSMLMRQATEDKTPPWLQEGFSSYCENAITKKNLCRTVEYEMNEVKIGPNWDQEIKKFANQGKLKTWEQIFPLHMEGIKALDYLSCYSIVSFLIKGDAPRFNRFVMNIRDGMDTTPALEKAYGRKVRDLQIMWASWVMQQR